MIILLHSRFDDVPNGTNGTCNNGKVLAYSLPINNSNNCYTSLLCVMVTPAMAGKTVECTHDNGTKTQNIGNYSIPPNTAAATINPFTGNMLFVWSNLYQTFIKQYPLTVISVSVQGITTDSNPSKGTQLIISFPCVCRLPCLCLCSCLCLCVSATNSLSSGEVEAIVISCSVILVGVVIIVIMLSAFGLMFRRKQLQSITTISSTHTSSTDTRQQTIMSQHAQNDEVNNYYFILNKFLH